ncbi:hypothetical protein [Muricoccus radiodurans]|uniref:hypothetical protein n=1 Tax=Muricoccus radiodurans TaxID=2231721 RepID=UPI003CED11F0
MTPKLSLRRGDHLIREGVRFKVLRRAKDGSVNLERTDDDTMSSVPEDQLIREYGEGQLEIDRRQEVVQGPAAQLLEGDFASLSEAAKAKAEFRVPFVRKMLEDRRRQWSNRDLATLIECVRQEKGFKKGPSPRSLRRWANRAIALGFDQLPDVRILVPRNHACGGSHDKFGAEVQSIMDGVIDDLVMVPEKTSGSDAYLEIRARISAKEAELKTRFGASAPSLPVPSKRTFYRRLGSISEEAISLARDGRLETDRNHSLVGRGPQGDYLLHEVEIDHTPIDVIVVCPLTGIPIGRPTVTIALDRWSRMIVGVHVGLEGPGWHAAMMCLRNAILPKTTLLGVDREDLRARYPWDAMGIMDVLVLDNGPEFHSAALRSAAKELGITLQYCPAGQPRYKGKVERLFRRANVELFHTLPGTTFSNSAMRGKYDSKAEARLTVTDVRALVHQWIADIYCRTPHSFTKQTPNERWAEGLRQRGGVSLPNSAADVMLSLANAEYRRLTSKGIELYGLHYSNPRDPRLRALLNHPDRPQAFKVRVGSENLGTVHVEDFREPGHYVPVPCIDRKYAEGLSLGEHHAIMARTRMNLKARQAATMAMLTESKAKLRAAIAQVRQAGNLSSTKLNAIYPALTGKITDIGEDGNPVPVASGAAPVAPPRKAEPQGPVVLDMPQRKFAISFG